MTRVDEAPHTVELDECWLAEWFAYGFREIDARLTKEAAFDAWLVSHHRSEHPEHSVESGPASANSPAPSGHLKQGGNHRDRH